MAHSSSCCYCSEYLSLFREITKPITLALDLGNGLFRLGWNKGKGCSESDFRRACKEVVSVIWIVLFSVSGSSFDK